MSNVRQFKGYTGQGPQVDGSGGGGDDTYMDHEKRLTSIETVMPTLATKTDVAEIRADLHRMDASIKTWMLGTVVTIIGAMLAAIFGVAQMFRLSTPASAPTSAPPPVIINIPSQQPPAAMSAPAK